MRVNDLCDIHLAVPQNQSVFIKKTFHSSDTTKAENTKVIQSLQIPYFREHDMHTFESCGIVP